VHGLRAGTDNSATKALKVFKEAIKNAGAIPSRVRGDRGGENSKISVWMIVNQGFNRGSFLWGS
jgi:hypothetical protein